MKVVKDRLLENSIINAKKLISQLGFEDNPTNDLCCIFKESLIKAMDEFEEDKE